MFQQKVFLGFVDLKGFKARRAVGLSCQTSYLAEAVGHPSVNPCLTFSNCKEKAVLFRKVTNFDIIFGSAFCCSDG